MERSALSLGLRGTLLIVSIAAALSACDYSDEPAPVAYRAGPALAPLPPPGTLGRAHPDSIVVEPGQTLFDVSRLYDIPTRAIIDANRLEPPYRMNAGRTLVLPQVRTHLVRGGDTVYSVSRQYGVEASTLVATNHLQPPFTIFSGTVLVLPPQAQAAVGPASAGSITATPLPPLPSQSIAAAPLPPAPNTPAPTSVSPPTAAAAPQAPAPVPAPAPAVVASKPPPPPPPAPATAVPPPPDQTAALPPALRGGRSFLWPLKGQIIGRHGPTAAGTQNDGINIAAAEGTPVLAADSGTVAYAGNELRGYGNLILLKHSDGWMTAYAHNAQLLVARGQKVQRGQVIARVGATGAVSEPQLHFEVRQGTRALDPMDYLAPAPVSG